MKKLVITILIILVALVVWLIIKSNNMKTALEPQPVEDTGGVSGQFGKLAASAIAVQDQLPGSTVIVAVTSLQEGGFIVIKKDDAGKVGAIIGVSEFLPAGVHEKIDVGTTESLLDGVKYYALTYKDDGNGIFDPKDDSENVTTEFMVNRDAEDPRKSEINY